MSESTDKQLPDEQLDEYLKGDSSVSRQYRQLHSAEVPPQLDRLVLRQAQDAVQAAPAKSRTWTRWTGPLAMAASAVLVVSIVIETGVQDEVALTAAKAPAPAAAPQMEAQRRSEAVESEAVDSVANEAPPPPPPFAPTPTQDSAADRAVMHDAPPPLVYIRVPEETSAPAFMATPEEPPAESARPAEKAEAPSAHMARRERRNAITRPPVAAPQQTSRPTSRPASPADTDIAEVIVTGNAVTSGELATTLPQYADPERWLQDIRELRKENKQEQADREWRRFRAAFPDHPVSEVDAAREVER